MTTTLDDRSSTAPAERAKLAAAHGRSVFGVVVRRVGDREVAADLTVRTFLRAPAGAGRGALCALAAGQVREWAAANGIAEPEPRGAGWSPLARPAAGSLGGVVDRILPALATMPPAQREALLLREQDGLGYDEIAAVLGTDAGEVASLIAGARETLLPLAGYP